MNATTVNTVEGGTHIEFNVPLAPMTTLRVGGPARALVTVQNEAEIPGLVAWARSRAWPILVLGGGSNAVIADSGFPGLVLRMAIRGITAANTEADALTVTVGAGERWDDFVAHAVHMGWWGVENMSLVPGSVGAVAVQNVSAYGQECSRIITTVRAFDMRENRFVDLCNADCGFGFRVSRFNTSDADRFVIVAITFRLSHKGRPNLSRRQVAHMVARMRPPGSPASPACTQSDVRAAIIRLRTTGGLLPPPDTVGNAGTFFRAGIVPHQRFWHVVARSCRHAGFSLALKLIACRLKLSSTAGVKVPSNLLISACRLQDVGSGGVSLLPSNCAVLITARAHTSTAGDILNVIRRIRTVVHEKTGIAVPVEPTLIGFTADELRTLFALPPTDTTDAPPSDPL